MSNYYDHSLARLMADFVPFQDEVVFEFSSDRRDDLDDASARILDESFRNNGRLVNATLVA